MDSSPPGGAGSAEPELRGLSASSLERLSQLAPFDVWMFTTVIGGEQVVLTARGADGSSSARRPARWSDSFCLRMVSGQGPRVSTDAQAIACYAAASRRHDFPIGAYAGYPLLTAQGRLFGTLCAVHSTRLTVSEAGLEAHMGDEARFLGKHLVGLEDLSTARIARASRSAQAVIVIEVPEVNSAAVAGVLAPMTPADVAISMPTPHRVELSVPERYSFELLSLTDAIEHRLAAHRIQGFFGFGVKRSSLDDARREAVAMASSR